MRGSSHPASHQKLNLATRVEICMVISKTYPLQRKASPVVNRDTFNFYVLLTSLFVDFSNLDEARFH